MPFASKSTIDLMVAGASGVPVEAVTKVLEARDKVILAQLEQGQSVRLLDCGILKVKLRAPRRKRLPGGEAFIVPSKRALVFSPTMPFDKRVNPKTGPKPLRGRPTGVG